MSTEQHRRARDRRDRYILYVITLATGIIIAAVLFFAGAFTRSTG